MSSTRIQGLGAPEVRVLGCLIEKQRTTPDAYPLSLNALRLACNQSTNRDPIVDYDETMIREALRRLERRGLVRLASGAGSRAVKYRHLLAEALPLPAGEQALLCVLMLRGAQTPGELKQRTERLHPFGALAEVQEALEGLAERGLARALGRRPGQKEERYVQLLEGADEGGQALGEGAAVPPAAPREPAAERPLSPGGPTLGSPNGAASGVSVQELARRVARLEEELDGLREAVRALAPPGGGEA
jgi:uncharacterized protein YceH (UPF0502 family)